MATLTLSKMPCAPVYFIRVHAQLTLAEKVEIEVIESDQSPSRQQSGDLHYPVALVLRLTYKTLSIGVWLHPWLGYSQYDQASGL